MKKSVIILSIILILSGIVSSNQLGFFTHPTENIIGEFKEYKLTLEQAITGNYINSKRDSPISNFTILPQIKNHSMNEIYISINGVEMSVAEALNTPRGLCGTQESFYESQIILGHNGAEIEIRENVSLQEAINNREFCICGDNSNYNFSSDSCNCIERWIDENGDGTGSDTDGCEIKAPLPKSCKEILDSGNSVGNGVYLIDPDGNGTISEQEVYCDMTTEGGGWTLVVGLDKNSRTHINSNSVNPENLITLEGKGKFGDDFINAVQINGNNQLKLQCFGITTPEYEKGYDLYTNCNFDADAHPFYVDSDCYVDGHLGTGYDSGAPSKFNYGLVRGFPNWYGRTYGSQANRETGGCHDEWVGGWAGRDGRLWAR